jgi:hypothetical protein
MQCRAHRQTVKQNQQEYGLPLKILSYNDLYGWTMDRIVDQIGKKNNCEIYAPQVLRRLVADSKLIV